MGVEDCLKRKGMWIDKGKEKRDESREERGERRDKISKNEDESGWEGIYYEELVSTTSSWSTRVPRVLMEQQECRLLC